MTRYSRAERLALADTLRTIGPDAPTLCTGWLARDLAAHLVLREREPLAAAGIVLRPLAGYTARRQRRIAADDFPRLVERVRRPPVWSPVSNPLVEERVNVLEMYVHHEDLRRAQPGWSARPLDPGLAAHLWSRARGAARLMLRRFPTSVVVEWPEHDRVTVGAGPPTEPHAPATDPAGTADPAEPDGRQVVIRGQPGELVLFLTGRQAVAEVTLTGPDDLTTRLSHARLNI